MSDHPVKLWETVPGALLSRPERLWLRDTARLMGIQYIRPLIVNVGIWKGASMHCLRAGSQDARLVGIDVGLKLCQHPERLRAELIRKDSRQLGSWDRRIHLLFLDGGHSVEVVRSDIKTLGQHVEFGGIMALHDCDRSARYLRERERRYPARPPLGVRAAAAELCTPKQGWRRIPGVDSIGAFRRVGKHG